MASPLSGNWDPDPKDEEQEEEKTSHKIHGDQGDQQGAEREPGAGQEQDAGIGTALQVASKHMDLTWEARMESPAGRGKTPREGLLEGRS